MVVVFDKYTDNAKKMQEMMCRIGFNVKNVVLENDGFLPDTALSLYDYFIYGLNQKERKRRNLHYNFLDVPEFWEIRAVGEHGAVYDMGCKKADIYFKKYPNVQRVEWCMEEGWIYKIDYYNKYALKYVSEFLDKDGNVESRVFYSCRNQEVIVEQPQNNMITLLKDGKVKSLFTIYSEFVEYFLNEIGLEEKYILFVQDQDRFRILNLQSEGKSIWECVLFSDNELMNQYKDLGGKNGYHFYFIPEKYPSNDAKGEVLILTCADQLEQIEYLIHELPEIVFHIGANTQVSDKLNKLGNFQNVKIYPQISKEKLSILWDKCDFYFDINYYREIYNAIDIAHQKNLLIMGFKNTIHRQELVAEECIYSQLDEKKFVLEMKKIVNHPELIQGLLEKQQRKKYEIWEKVMGVI